MRTNIIYITLSCKRTPCIEVARTSCLASSLNIFIGKTLDPSSRILFTYPSIGRKPYITGLPATHAMLDA